MIFTSQSLPDKNHPSLPDNVLTHTKNNDVMNVQKKTPKRFMLLASMFVWGSFFLGSLPACVALQSTLTIKLAPMLKLFDRYWIALVMLLSIAALPVRIHAATPTIVFSEIAWAGSSLSSSDEWIELTNVSETSIDLSNWKISGAGSSDKDLLLPEGSVIEPHSTYLIANYENTNESAAYSTSANFVTSTVSLSNSGLGLSLYDSAGTLIDVAGNGDAPFAGRSGSVADSDDGRYASMVRMDGLTDGSLPESWTDAQTSSGFKEGIQDYGSPGSVLFASSQPIETTQETTETEQEVANEEVNTVEEAVPVEESSEEADTTTVVEETVSPETTEQDSVPTENSVSETNSAPEDSTSSATVLINEFVIDPNEDETEWIELRNISEQTLDLTLWTLEDESGKQTTLEGSLVSNGFLLIDSPVGKLNNDTDTIILKNSTGIVVDSVTYGTEELTSPKDGASLARNASGLFEVTYTPTPASENIFSSQPPEPDQEPVEETQTDGEPVTTSESNSSSQEEVAQDSTSSSSESVSELTTTQESTGSSSSQTSINTQESIPTGTILINEFVADPLEGEEEWIEITNISEHTATLTGWTLEDASGKITDLSSVTINGSSYVVVVSPKGKLNNDGDTIVLKDANGTVVDSVVYGADAYPVPKDGMSLARNGQTFELTQQTTQGSANVIFIALTEEDLEQETPSAQEESEEDTSSAPSQTTEESSSESTTILIKTVRFSKLYPNTSGSDETEEYIELFNTGTETIDLMGWSIEDGSTDRYTIKDSFVLQAQTAVRLMRPQTTLALNNAGDTLELIAPDKNVVDKVTYGNAAKGAVYQFANGSWSWSQPSTTTSSLNHSTAPSLASSTVSKTSTSASYTSSSVRVNQLITITQAQQKKDGERVTVKGVVIAIPGTFGTQVCYVMDETGGIQIYLHDGSYPALALGDVVELTGELSTSHGERRIKLDEGTDIHMNSETFSIKPMFYPVTDIEELLVGQLISTKGQIQSKNGTKLVIEQLGTMFVVYLKSNPAIDPNLFERGDLITITGVLSVYDGELRIRPRSSEDIAVDQSAEVATASSEISDQTPTPSSQAGTILLLSTMGVLGLLALWHYRPRKQLAVTA